MKGKNEKNVKGKNAIVKYQNKIYIISVCILYMVFRKEKGYASVKKY